MITSTTATTFVLAVLLQALLFLHSTHAGVSLTQPSEVSCPSNLAELNGTFYQGTWGDQKQNCFGNLVKGISNLHRFSFFLALNQMGTVPTGAQAFIYDWRNLTAGPLVQQPILEHILAQVGFNSTAVNVSFSPSINLNARQKLIAISNRNSPNPSVHITCLLYAQMVLLLLHTIGRSPTAVSSRQSTQRCIVIFSRQDRAVAGNRIGFLMLKTFGWR